MYFAPYGLEYMYLDPIFQEVDSLIINPPVADY